MSKNKIRHLFDIKTPMRDGILLSSDIFLPEKPGKYPAILQRTPYDNTNPFWIRVAKYFAEQGYAFISQDVRGRCDSEGEWRPLFNEVEDGYDTIEWIAEQEWCTGKIGMMGGSYGGFVQWMAAKANPPHLTTLISTATAARLGHEFPFMNGKMILFVLYWLNLVGGKTLQAPILGSQKDSLIDWQSILNHRPLLEMDEALGRTNTIWREWLTNPELDEYWEKINLEGAFASINLPVLHITGWFDDDGFGQLYTYNKMIKESPASDLQHLLVGPWDHPGTRMPKEELGELSFGEEAVLDMNAIHLKWFDHWLKGKENGVMDQARVKIFCMGKNQWQVSDQWELPQKVMTPLYIDSNGNANTAQGNGILSFEKASKSDMDEYTYDPEDPTPGMQSFPEEFNPTDQGFAEKREDVLVFTSEPLEKDIQVTGSPWAVLYAETDVTDTDFAAVLTDVDPDGKSVRIAENIMRTSYRESLKTPSPIEPGKVYEYRIEMNATSMTFKKGHRIRLDIMSARFPLFARNPNTGAPEGQDEKTIPAHQKIHHSDSYPSHVLLPIIPENTVNSEKL